MRQQHLHISKAIEKLKANLPHVTRVMEWSDLMGYDHPQRFARTFMRHYSVRPKKMLEYIRLKSIIRELRKGKSSNFEIARQHGILDEIVLNKFINYHIGCSPSKVKNMTDEDINKILNKNFRHSNN